MNAETIFHNIRLHDLIEDYNSSLKFIKELSKLKVNLQIEDLALFTRCFKCLIGGQRAQYRKIIALMTKDSLIENKANFDLLDILRSKLEGSILQLCKDVIEICTNFSSVNITNPKIKLFFIKNKADHYRYMYEITEEEQYKTKAKDNYLEGNRLANTAKIDQLDIILLTFKLNYTVFLHDTMGLREKAIEEVKQWMHTSFENIKKVEDTNQKDVILLYQMIKDNLTLWKNEVGDA